MYLHSSLLALNKVRYVRTKRTFLPPQGSSRDETTQRVIHWEAEALHKVKVTLEGLGNWDRRDPPSWVTPPTTTTRPQPTPLPRQSFGPLCAPLFLLRPASLLPPPPALLASPSLLMQITPSLLSLSLTQRASLPLSGSPLSLKNCECNTGEIYIL